MTSKERVYAAIQHQPTDRVPRFIWVGEGAEENIKQADSRAQWGTIDEYVKNDVLQTWLSINKQMMVPASDKQTFVDEWGITWKREGYYNAPVHHPLQGMSTEQIEQAALPDPLAPERFATFKQLLHSKGDRYFIGADVSGTLFEPAYHLRSMEELLMDLAGGTEADALLNRLEEFSTAVALEAVRLGADWVWLGDDMGTQENMILSPDMWRKHFKPRMQRIIQAIHKQKPTAIIAYHSCGSMYPIIGDLVEIGVDVLNPLQESAAHMNQQQIKQEYGDVLTLMCGLDTQTFLLDATPEQSYRAMQRTIEQLAEGGGYIAAVSHTLQHDVPTKNILAILQALDNA